MTNALQPVVDFIQKAFRPRNANQGGKNSPRSLCFISALLNILVDSLHKSFGDKGKNQNGSPPMESGRGGLGEEPSISTSRDSVGRLSDSHRCQQVSQSRSQSQSDMLNSAQIENGERHLALTIDFQVIRQPRHVMLRMMVAATTKREGQLLPASNFLQRDTSTFRVTVPHRRGVRSLEVYGSFPHCFEESEPLYSQWDLDLSVTVDAITLELPILPSQDGTGELGLRVDRSLVAQMKFTVASELQLTSWVKRSSPDIRLLPDRLPEGFRPMRPSLSSCSDATKSQRSTISTTSGDGGNSKGPCKRMLISKSEL